MTLERTVGVVRVQFPADRVTTRRGSGQTEECSVPGRRPRAPEEATLAHAPRDLITTPIPEPGPSSPAASGTLTVLPGPPDRTDLRRPCASGDVDVVLTQLRDVVDADLLAAAQARGVSNVAVGHNNIDVRAATRHGILAGNTPRVLTDATAEVAVALRPATSRRVVEGDRLVREGRFTEWEPELPPGRDVSGAVLGLAGSCRIARATARRAMGFGMEILFAPRPPGDRAVSGDELGEITGAGLDAYEDEPRPAPGPADLSNTVLLPHVGSATVPVRREMSRLSALNAIAMAEARMPPHAVTPEAMG